MVKTEKEIREILQQVPDPEIPVLTIEDLGILRDVEYIDDKVIIYITPTYSGCPAMDMITVNIKAALQEAGIDNFEVKLVLSPAWTTDWMSDEAKEKLEKYGIAPPRFSDDKSPITCPNCKSENTSLLSQFGSTACKALYRCNDCKEPFDYFKCY